MRFLRSVLIAVLVSVLLPSSLFAQTKTIGAGLDTMVLVPAGEFIMGRIRARSSTVTASRLWV